MSDLELAMALLAVKGSVAVYRSFSIKYLKTANGNDYHVTLHDIYYSSHSSEEACFDWIDNYRKEREASK